MPGPAKELSVGRFQEVTGAEATVAARISGWRSSASRANCMPHVTASS